MEDGEDEIIRGECYQKSDRSQIYLESITKQIVSTASAERLLNKLLRFFFPIFTGSTHSEDSMRCCSFGNMLNIKRSK